MEMKDLLYVVGGIVAAIAGLTIRSILSHY